MFARGVHLRSWASVVLFWILGQATLFFFLSFGFPGARWWCAPVAHAGTLSRRLADASWVFIPGVLMILLMRLGLIPASLWFSNASWAVPALNVLYHDWATYSSSYLCPMFWRSELLSDPRLRALYILQFPCPWPEVCCAPSSGLMLPAFVACITCCWCLMDALHEAHPAVWIRSHSQHDGSS